MAKAKEEGAVEEKGRLTPGRARRESRQAKRARAAEIFARLSEEYPNSRVALDFRNAYELLAATVLAAQCTDKKVNEVTPALFRRFPTPEALAQGNLAEIEELVRQTGFYRNKAKAILGFAQALVRDHGGEVPKTMEALTALPGVGRKTANVVLGNAYGIASGIVVDTHVLRLSQRLGLTEESDPVKIESALNDLVPQGSWIEFGHVVTDHGRAVCHARKPECGRCVVADLCPSAEV